MKKTKIIPNMEAGVVRKYFSLAQVDKKKANYEDYKLVFMLALDDFFNDKLKVDDLEDLAGAIYYSTRERSPVWFDSFPDRIGNALYWASDLSYYYHKGKRDKETNRKYQDYLKEVKEYYEANTSWLRRRLEK
ncbi:MAG: hypothetical protein ABIB61_00570 [Candidatus Shapirobacteria bacterium]